ncbi:PTPRZ1 [Cordylochernes scorpioides]|uniref:PTPRZ1 n=1 Tax=Cordylochernes scorpioides TaxID=51811 RepID=A0ABY6LT82_9ARAC|nr:PTPRZ1 [Cordylochernes scorpioides]
MWCVKKKCDLYWPQEGSAVYGIMQVRLVRELIMATYIIRTFTITNLRVKKCSGVRHALRRSHLLGLLRTFCTTDKRCFGPSIFGGLSHVVQGVGERTVYQYHYTSWPDHGVPDHPLPVLSFVLKSSRANPAGAGPIIVHCSAGVGRTGTYIVLDAMLRQIRHRGTVNVYGFLRHIRSQRNYLVQTEEQYIFVHDALLEAIESGETELTLAQLPAYISALQGNDGHGGLLDKHFKLVTSFSARDYNVVSAVKPCNKNKNRSLNVIPLEMYRVHISQQPDGADYINATFLPEYPCFWPTTVGEEHQFATFSVKREAETESPIEGLELIELTLKTLQDDQVFKCRMFHWPGWPDVCSDLASTFRLVFLVQEWQAENPSGPIVVIDKFGGRDGATFCCLTTFYKQLKYENSFDAYMYAKLYHMRRPGIWRTRVYICKIHKISFKYSKT